MISFDDFKKAEIRVAKVIEVEDLEKSDHLLRLHIDLGDEQRWIVSGIKQFYGKDELLGREIIVVANLEPRVIFGFESKGMLLAANESGKPVLLSPDKEVAPGTKIT